MRWLLKKKRQRLMIIKKMNKKTHISGKKNLQRVIVALQITNKVTDRVQEIKSINRVNQLGM